MTTSSPAPENTFSLQQIVKDVLSPADHFARLRANSESMEKVLWEEIGAWHPDCPDALDAEFVIPEQVRRVVKEICSSYNAKTAIESVLAYLYLKHRDLFLHYPQDFFCYSGGFYLFPPMDENDECGRTKGYGYNGCSGAIGDIVDFESIDPDKIFFQENFPRDAAWAQLRSDHQLALGFINYGKLLPDVRYAIRQAVECRSRKLTHLSGLENLACWASELECDDDCMLPLIALVAHAVLLQHV